MTHLSRDVLEKYIAGELRDRFMDRVSLHLRHCESCAALLHRIEAEDADLADWSSLTEEDWTWFESRHMHLVGTVLAHMSGVEHSQEKPGLPEPPGPLDCALSVQQDVAYTVVQESIQETDPTTQVRSCLYKRREVTHPPGATELQDGAVGLFELDSLMEWLFTEPVSCAGLWRSQSSSARLKGRRTQDYRRRLACLCTSEHEIEQLSTMFTQSVARADEPPDGRLVYSRFRPTEGHALRAGTRPAEVITATGNSRHLPPLPTTVFSADNMPVSALVDTQITWKSLPIGEREKMLHSLWDFVRETRSKRPIAPTQQLFAEFTHRDRFAKSLKRVEFDAYLAILQLCGEIWQTFRGEYSVLLPELIAVLGRELVKAAVPQPDGTGVVLESVLNQAELPPQIDSDQRSLLIDVALEDFQQRDLIRRDPDRSQGQLILPGPLLAAVEH